MSLLSKVAAPVVPNELVLCVAHRPLTPNVLRNLVRDSGSTSVDSLRRTEAAVGKAAAERARASPRDVADGDRDNDSDPTIHVLVTGSPYTIQDGRTFQDWEKKWTRGEQILADVVESVGMENFHSILRGGSVRMKAKLISVKENDFAMFRNPRQRFEREISWIADYVVSHLKLSRADRVGKATILYPINDDDDENEAVNVVEVINEVLRREWSEKNGLLEGVEVIVKTVASR